MKYTVHYSPTRLGERELIGDYSSFPLARDKMMSQAYEDYPSDLVQILWRKYIQEEGRDLFKIVIRPESNKSFITKGFYFVTATKL